MFPTQKNNAVFDIAVPADHFYTVLQKPMGENWEEAKRNAERCKRKLLVSAVNFQLRYVPSIDRTKKGNRFY